MKQPIPVPSSRRGNGFRIRTLGLLVAWVLALAGIANPRIAHAAPVEDGLFAGFVTTQGEFWCRLEFTKVPRTVASFVSLAEGTRDWVDFKTAKVVRRPFYSGIRFHRVIDDFMIQAGSPNGEGTDGPGYMFANEFHPTLRHSKAGILSMANSGTNAPNPSQGSNGSQFFVTVTNTPWLDDKHSVFGEVVEGMDIVYRISQVPRDATDRPTTPVVIQEVRVLRNGAAAQAFDPATVVPPLPDVGVVPIALQDTPNALNLLIQSRTNHHQHAFFGSDFQTWSSQTFRSSPTNINATSLKGLPRLFFRVLDGGIEP
jgi:cyclophilin family peptidyl-prolyl cis-trans isomerase